MPPSQEGTTGKQGEPVKGVAATPSSSLSLLTKQVENVLYGDAVNLGVKWDAALCKGLLVCVRVAQPVQGGEEVARVRVCALAPTLARRPVSMVVGCGRALGVVCKPRAMCDRLRHCSGAMGWERASGARGRTYEGPSASGASWTKHRVMSGGNVLYGCRGAHAGCGRRKDAVTDAQ